MFEVVFFDMELGVLEAVGISELLVDNFTGMFGMKADVSTGLKEVVKALVLEDLIGIFEMEAEVNTGFRVDFEFVILVVFEENVNEKKRGSLISFVPSSSSSDSGALVHAAASELSVLVLVAVVVEE